MWATVRRMAHLRTLGALLLVIVPALAAAQPARRITTERLAIEVSTVHRGLEHPWGVAFLDSGRLVVTERVGRLRLFDQASGLSEPLRGVPAVFARGQGGLLDVALDPHFETSRLVYLTYAEPFDSGRAATAVLRARLVADGEPRLEDARVIFRQLPPVESPGHFGSRLAFARDGSLFVTLGERQASYFAVRAQDLETHFGKVVRIMPDGAPPPDNPFLSVPGAQPHIWSYGHRNVQGAAIHPDSGELWIVEHGPKGGDELNIVKRSANYGWPVVTYGRAYSGGIIGLGQERPGMERPVHYWVPSIATSSLMFYTHERLAPWRGSAFVSGLYGVLARLEIDADRVVHEERLLEEINERIRTVAQAPDGSIYLLTDGAQGAILRIDGAAR